MFNAMSSLHTALTNKVLKSFTSDRDKEFACYLKFEQLLSIPMYFSDAYTAWQRSSNENSNSLLREFFPKKTDLAKVTIRDLTESLLLLNNRPRKCLGFKSLFDMFKHEIYMI